MRPGILPHNYSLHFIFYHHLFQKRHSVGEQGKTRPPQKKTRKKTEKKEKLIRSNVRSRIQSLPVEEFFSFFLNMQKDFLLIQTFLNPLSLSGPAH